MRSSELLIMTNPLVMRSSELLGRTNPLVMRSSELLMRTNPAVMRSSELLGRTCTGIRPGDQCWDIDRPIKAGPFQVSGVAYPPGEPHLSPDLPLPSPARMEIWTVRRLLQAFLAGRLRRSWARSHPFFGTEDSRLLMQSLLDGLPIGTLFFSEEAAPAGSQHFGMVYSRAGATDRALRVIDGQRRLDTVIGALLHELPEEDEVPLIPRWFLLNLRDGQVRRASREVEGTIPLALLWPDRLLPWLRAHPLGDAEESRLFRHAERLLEAAIPVAIVSGRSVEDQLRAHGRLNATQQGERLVSIGFLEESAHPARDRWAATVVESSMGGSGLFADGERLSELAPKVWAAAGIRASSPEALFSDSDLVDAFDRALRQSLQFLARRVSLPRLGLLDNEPLIELISFFFRFHRPRPRSLLLLQRWLWRKLWLEAAGVKGAEGEQPWEGGFYPLPGDEARVQALLSALPMPGPGQGPDRERLTARLRALIYLASTHVQPEELDPTWALLIDARDWEGLLSAAGTPDSEDLIRFLSGRAAWEQSDRPSLDNLLSLLPGPDDTDNGSHDG